MLGHGTCWLANTIDASGICSQALPGQGVSLFTATRRLQCLYHLSHFVRWIQGGPCFVIAWPWWIQLLKPYATVTSWTVVLSPRGPALVYHLAGVTSLCCLVVRYLWECSSFVALLITNQTTPVHPKMSADREDEYRELRGRIRTAKMDELKRIELQLMRLQASQGMPCVPGTHSLNDHW